MEGGFGWSWLSSSTDDPLWSITAEWINDFNCSVRILQMLTGFFKHHTTHALKFQIRREAGVTGT